MIQTQGRSARMERAFDRMAAEYGRPTTTETFTAAGVYDKLGLLVLLALATGAVGYVVDNPGLILLGIVAGLVFSLIGVFKPATARYVAPLYAAAEGLALGALTGQLATANNGLVSLAIIFTGAIFVAALVIFRTGLVKVTPKFASMTMMALFGLLAVILASALGVPGLSGAGGSLVIGVVGVAIGVACLFMDFDYIQIGEERRLPVEGEWYGALTLMISLVFVYVNVLRIVARRR